MCVFSILDPFPAKLTRFDHRHCKTSIDQISRRICAEIFIPARACDAQKEAMARLNKGLPTLIALAASLFLFYLLGSVPNEGNKSMHSGFAAGDDIAIPAHLVKLKLETTAAKIGIPFGHPYAGHLAEKAPSSSVHAKRDGVTITW